MSEESPKFLTYLGQFLSELGRIFGKAMTHCVIYRTGGTENFIWHRSVAMTSDEAIQVQRDLSQMGYRSHIERYQRSLAAGLPETYWG